MEERKQEEDATDYRPHGSRTEQTTDDLWKEMWIRKEPDEDGYFLLQLSEVNNMFLTSEDGSSLKMERKYCWQKMNYIIHFKTWIYDVKTD